MSVKLVQAGTFYLAGSGTIIGATSVVLTSFQDIYGNVLTMTDFGAKIYATVEPDTNNEESFTATGVVANANGTYTLTGVSTALARSPFTETSGLIRQHSGGTKMVLSDTTALWNTFGNKANDEVLTGRWSTGVTPSNANDIANKSYVDGVAIAGAPNASDSVKGISKLSVAPVSGTNPIAVGDNDGRVPTQAENDALVGNNTDIAVGSGNKFVTQTGLQHNAEKYAADTSGSTTAYVITLSPAPTSYTAGMVVYAKIVNANTTTTPTINVNGLGAKTIVKFVSTALSAGDIGANSFNTFIYDGTNFVLQNPIPLGGTVYKVGTATRPGNAASGSQTIAHGLGTVPKYVRITAFRNDFANSGNGSIVKESKSVGVYNGTNTATTWAWALSVGQNSDSSDSGVNTTNIVHIIANYQYGVTSQVATISVDATNITLTWTYSVNVAFTSNPLNMVWEANS